MLHDANKNKYKMKVEVIGGSKKKEPEKKETQGRVVSVDMKSSNTKVITTYNDEQKASIDMLRNLKITLPNIGAITAAKTINLELKRNFIECTGDTGFDVDTNQYLDKILFDSIERFILDFLTSDNKNTDATISIINQSIFNSVNMLDYHDGFNYKKMNWIVESFVEVFK